MWELIANLTVIAYLVFLAVLIFIDLVAAERKIKKLSAEKHDLELRLKEAQSNHLQYVLGYELNDYQLAMAKIGVQQMRGNDV